MHGKRKRLEMRVGNMWPQQPFRGDDPSLATWLRELASSSLLLGDPLHHDGLQAITHASA